MAFKMKGSPMQRNFGISAALKKDEDEKTEDIIGEQTYEAKKNKNTGQLELGLATDIDKSPSPDHGGTKQRLIVKDSDNIQSNTGGKLKEGDFIEQFEKLKIKKDSTGTSGNTYYSIVKNK